MENIKEISVGDFISFNSIVQEYLLGTSEEELNKLYNDKNNVFIGYYLDNKLIGVCFGEIFDNENYSLVGIAITYPYNKQGRGSKLLKYFEDIVKIKGYKNITVGSADGYVEHFYIKNGYILLSLKILTDNDEWKKIENEIFPITKIETQGKYIKLVIENICYETTDKNYLCKYYNGCECFYVFKKMI